MVNSTYIKQISEQVNLATDGCGPVLLYGENINVGSCISGLARGLKVNPAGKVLNVGNCELAHIGIGLGLMADGGNAVLFMKQLDFLLLGIDQVVNTFNCLRAYPSENGIGSFTIYSIVCDQGYQGPQSSFNAGSDIASLANISVFCLNGSEDISNVIQGQFVSPGFRVICVSQRLLGSPSLELPVESFSPDRAIFKYQSGNDLTLACYNFTLREGVDLAAKLSRLGIQSDLFHVNFVPGMDISLLQESCARTRKLVLIDDSKSVTKFGDMHVMELQERGLEFSSLSLFRRGCKIQEYGVIEDQFVLNMDALHLFLGRPSGFF